MKVRKALRFESMESEDKTLPYGLANLNFVMEKRVGLTLVMEKIEKRVGLTLMMELHLLDHARAQPAPRERRESNGIGRHERERGSFFNAAPFCRLGGSLKKISFST